MVDGEANGAVAERRLERASRQLQGVSRKAAVRMGRRRRRLEKEWHELDVLNRQTLKLMEEAAAMKREADERFAQLDLREFLVFHREQALADTQTKWTTQRDMFEVEGAAAPW